MSRRLPLLAFLAALLAGALLRFLDLTVRPLHHDEGVNCLFLLDLVRKGHYAYDPENYHGPLLYFMVAPLLALLGEQTVVLRLWPAALGTATIAVFWPLRRVLGEWGAVAAAWLLALSPSTVYFNRDLIHESWFVAAAALLAGSAATFASDPRPRWIRLGWVGFAALVATKETAPLVVLALAAGGALALWLRHGRNAPGQVLAHLREHARAHLSGATIATAILVVLFTSFFRNPEGFLDMFRAYALWTRTGTHGMGHEKAWPYFFELLWRYERPAWTLGALGLAVATARRAGAAGVGLAGLVLLAVHSAIPYKTPWLMIGFVPWLAGSAGWLVERAGRSLSGRLGPVAAGLAFALFLPFLAREAIRVSWFDYDDDAEPIVYSQTRRSFLDLVAALRAVSDAHPLGRAMPVEVFAPEHFPLNWYTRDFTAVPYWGSLRAFPADGVAILSRADERRAREGLDREWRARSFDLRPGVELVLAVPAERFAAAQAAIPEPGRWARWGPVELLPGIAGEELARPLAPGLVARGYPGDRPDGEPQWSEPGRPVHVDFDHGKSPWPAPFSIEWTGWLLVEEEGLHRFSLESDDGSNLVIDGWTVVDNWGRHAVERQDGAVRLGRGWHRLRLGYMDLGGGAKLFWRWRPPGAASEAPVPGHLLAHDPGE